MMSELNRYQYIDALRGFAFLGVLTVHASYEVPKLPFSSLPELGQYGVQLFFLLSAVTLLRSMALRSAKERFAARNFFIRRFFRIAPLFWTGVVLYGLLDGCEPRFTGPGGTQTLALPQHLDLSPRLGAHQHQLGGARRMVHRRGNDVLPVPSAPRQLGDDAATGGVGGAGPVGGHRVVERSAHPGAPADASPQRAGSRAAVPVVLVPVAAPGVPAGVRGLSLPPESRDHGVAGPARPLGWAGRGGGLRLGRADTFARQPVAPRPRFRSRHGGGAHPRDRRPALAAPGEPGDLRVGHPQLQLLPHAFRRRSGWRRIS